MHHSSGWGRFGIVALALLGGGRLLAATPATLVGLELGSEPVSISALQDGLLVYFDTERRLCEAPLDQFVQLRDIGVEKPGAGGSPNIELLDGQRLTGQWQGGTGEHFTWRHPAFGDLIVGLDDLLALTRVGEPVLSASGQDTVRLVNGDLLSGFVTAVEPTGFVMMPAGAAQTLVLPWDRVEAVRLASTPMELSSALDGVVLVDGSRLQVGRIDIRDDRVELEVRLPGRPVQSVQLPMDAMTRIDFRAGGARLLDLGHQPMTVRAGGSVFGLPARPRVEADDIYLHAPVTVSFAVPASVGRFVATAELDRGSDLAPRVEAWADFEIVVRHGAGDSESRYRLNGQSPRVQINLPVESGDELVIELDPGVNGPILDRLRLRDAVLLDRTGAEETSQAPAW